MKKACRLALLCAILLFLNTLVHAQSSHEIYQVSTINALLQGVYDGETTLKELRRHGDFGIGTFNGLDGELIGIDGQYFQIKGNGQVLPVDASMKTPFATVTHFKAESAAETRGIADYDHLQKSLDEIKKGQNYFYAIRIDGIFTYVKTRSVPAQDKPYRPLAEVTKNQPVFEYNNVKGTLIGFWCPPYANGVNVPGYHLHFISDDRRLGGHLLACGITSGTIRIARVDNFHMVLPNAEEFRQAAINKDLSKEVKMVEK